MDISENEFKMRLAQNLIEKEPLSNSHNEANKWRCIQFYYEDIKLMRQHAHMHVRTFNNGIDLTSKEAKQPYKHKPTINHNCMNLEVNESLLHNLAKNIFKKDPLSFQQGKVTRRQRDKNVESLSHWMYLK